MAAPIPRYSLAHPIYLDVPMMLSFLAHLEGGVSVGEEETKMASGARERLTSGRLGARLKLLGVGDTDLAAEANSQRHDEASSESRTHRHHTAASLFNLLYDYLREDDQLVDLGTVEQLEELRSGHLVEMNAEYLGNPLEDVLAFVGSIASYMDMSQLTAGAGVSPPAGSRSSNPAKRAAAKGSASAPPQAVPREPSVVELLVGMSDEISKTPVHDLLFQTEEGLKAVVTVSSEYYSEVTNEYLRAGEFRLVGKVTKVLRGEASINLTRRTVVGAAGPEMAESMVDSVNTSSMSLDVASPIVRAPAVQILPMAVFI
ncbi:DUF6414 family protein [Geodermatophilus nigrescens]